MMTQSIFLELISTWKQPSEKEPKFIIVCCFVKVERGEGDDMQWTDEYWGRNVTT